MANIPDNFDGAAFAAAYNLTEFDFHVDNGVMICESLPNLTDQDLAQFVVDTARLARIHARRDNAKLNAKAIPGWALWDEDEALAWWNANLSDVIVDALAIPVEAKNVLKSQNMAIRNMGRMLIALRDKTWPDLPED